MTRTVPHTERSGSYSWMESLVRFLDDGWRLPGTSLRFGADALLGLLFPGLGDALTATVSASLLWLAVRRGIPSLVLARMGLNIALDALLGCVPLAGDAFDFAWKANRKNWQLLERYRDEARPRTPHASDYAVMLAVGFLLVAAVALPFVVTGALVRYLRQSWS